MGRVRENINIEKIGYKKSEQIANEYFQNLCNQVRKKTYATMLTKDFSSWQKKHLRKRSLLDNFLGEDKKTAQTGYRSYIRWLNKRGKLDQYLQRSISYIYMRDLGSPIHLPQGKSRINSVVDSMKEQISNWDESSKERNSFSMASLYRKAEKEGVETTVIWLINKLKSVFNNMPYGIDKDEAKRKLIKIIAGVIMHQVEYMEDDISPQERKEKLNAAIRLGYCYGLTYPFIDDLLDAKVLSLSEKKQYSDLLRTTLTTKVVPDLKNWQGENKELVTYIHKELKEAFEYIKEYQNEDTIDYFFEQSYIFFNSQEIDRNKKLSNRAYTNEDIFIPIILKSSSSRLIVRSVISASKDQGFESRTFYYGIYNQLADDFTDMFEDMENESVTPYTYYMKYGQENPNIINPFEFYWTVICNLIHNVYDSDELVCDVILCRAINSLKRFKKRVGTEKYNEIMGMLDFKNTELSNLVQNMVDKAEDVDFFDKLLRDAILDVLKDEEREQEEFKNTVTTMKAEINTMLNIPKVDNKYFVSDPISEAANYCIDGSGKRIRPIMSWSMGIHGYGLDKSAMVPLVKSLEYMHTASLIYDDLPSQDNASMRRGNKTLHEVYDVSTAELSGLFLTQKAIEEQASLEKFNHKAVLKLIKYSTETIQKMCVGQAMDLHGKGRNLTIEQLKEMCFYKTGLAFEASLVMPAILGNANEIELEALREFSYYAGIAFQIKDDLLDVEGDSNLLGKVIGRDAENKNSTFVSVLGVEEAKKQMWQHYCNAMEVLDDFPRDVRFLKDFLNYIVNRDN